MQTARFVWKLGASVLPAMTILLANCTMNNNANPFDIARKRMVEEQLTGPGRNITNARVLSAMGSVPRHEFVLEQFRHRAYEDGPLPIGSGQTISQPYIVAFMTERLEPQPDERVLEIGTGSGYQAAVLA